ncbi:MAG TPA: ATP-binding protein [Mariprofundaceae bacterium]|nr:ATP-binding protein [Mariprofundaceae bacterium]
MRLYWKLFFAILAALILTASLTSWLSRQWYEENKMVETRLAELAGQGDTAANLYLTDGAGAYHRWLQFNMRSHRFHGMLLDAHGQNVLGQPIPDPLQPLAEQVMQEGAKVRFVQPPRLAVAIPVDTDNGRFYWLAATLMPHELMRQGSNQLLLFRLLVAIAVIALISLLLARMITRPVASLGATLRRLGDGRLDSRTEVSARRDELGELARNINGMAERLETLLQSHKQLLMDVSHELRSPLARLQVALELARNKSGDVAEKELDRIDREAERLGELIGEVLTLARFDEGVTHADKKKVQLDRLLTGIVEDARFEAEAAGKRIELATVECTLQADELWLGRAVDNVIRNAIRHTAAGSAVDVRMAKAASGIEIRVRDHGPGVPDEALSRLFEPFFRASAARDRDSGGYGLGLAITERAIRMHDGTITARNHPDGGLEATINLPSQG